VRRAVTAALGGAASRAMSAPQARPGLEAHGRLDAATIEAVRVRGIEDVVLPCLRALVGDGIHTSAHAA